MRLAPFLMATDEQLGLAFTATNAAAIADALNALADKTEMSRVAAVEAQLLRDGLLADWCKSVGVELVPEDQLLACRQWITDNIIDYQHYVVSIMNVEN